MNSYTHFWTAVAAVLAALSAALCFYLGHQWLTIGYGLHVYISIPACCLLLVLPLIMAEKVDNAHHEYMRELEDYIRNTNPLMAEELFGED